MPSSARGCPCSTFRRLLIMMTGVAALASGACATAGQPVPRPFPGASVPGISASAPVADERVVPDTPAAMDTPAAPVAPVLGDSIAQYALALRGVPYRLGGADLDGFDCSGLVQYVFAQHGIALPRVVEQQFVVGEDVEPADIRPGDLIFFNTKRPPSRSASANRGASHVGIVIADGQFVHAPNSRGVVRVEALESGYWSTRYIGARRIRGLMTSD